MSTMNDNRFREILYGLDPIKQRGVAAAFAENVLFLCSASRLSAIVSLAKRPDVTDRELAVAHQAANAIKTERLCSCGSEVDWAIQSRYFVYRAALDCVKPAKNGVNLAWDAAMNSRIARICDGIAKGIGFARQEAEVQYRILSDFMNKQEGA